MGYSINTAFYEGLSEKDTSDLFINKLNNVNDMNYQEKRNKLVVYLDGLETLFSY